MRTIRFPPEFIYENLAIATNVIHGAYLAKVDKLLFLGSSCIYPRLAQQPIVEEALLSGPLEPTNEWYAIAKVAEVKLCQAYRRQYGADFISVMRTMCSARVTIIIRRMPTSSRPSFGAFMKQRSPQHQP